MDDKSCKTPRWRALKGRLNNILPKKFKQKIEEAISPVIIDVRTPIEFQEGHIENAVNIGYLDETFWDQVEQFDKNQTFFVYCRTGRRSIRACTLMRNGGFDNERLFNLEGGYNLWQEVF